MAKNSSNKNKMLNSSINLILAIDEASSNIERKLKQYYTSLENMKRKIFNK